MTQKSTLESVADKISFIRVITGFVILSIGWCGSTLMQFTANSMRPMMEVVATEKDRTIVEMMVSIQKRNELAFKEYDPKFKDAFDKADKKISEEKEGERRIREGMEVEKRAKIKSKPKIALSALVD